VTSGCARSIDEGMYDGSMEADGIIAAQSRRRFSPCGVAPSTRPVLPPCGRHRGHGEWRRVLTSAAASSCCRTARRVSALIGAGAMGVGPLRGKAVGILAPALGEQVFSAAERKRQADLGHDVSLRMWCDGDYRSSRSEGGDGRRRADCGFSGLAGDAFEPLWGSREGADAG